MKNDIKDAFSAFFLGAAGAVAAVAFLAAPGGHGIAGLVNWPVLALAAVLGAVGAFLWAKQARHIPGPARGTALDRLGAIYNLKRRTRKTFTLPFATIRVMERDKDFRRRIARAAINHPQEVATYIICKQAQKGGLW